MEITSDHAGKFDEDPGTKTQHYQYYQTGCRIEIHDDRISAKQYRHQIKQQDRIPV